MRVSRQALAAALTLACLSVGSPTLWQTAPGVRSVETINVTGARPVAAAMDAIEEKYSVLIDYVDPQYSAAEDIQSVSYRPGRVTVGPKTRSISVEYTQVSVKPEPTPYESCNLDTLGCPMVYAQPQGGVTEVIQQVLDTFAKNGGQVFRVEKIEMPYGPRWEVFPEQTRDRSGKFVFQPAVLDANIYVPKENRTPADMLEAICNQLTSRWGHTFGVAFAPANVFMHFTGEMGAENVTARQALAVLMGRTWMLRLFYAPDDGMYYVNIENSPYRPPPPPRPLPPPQPASKVAAPSHLGPGQWLGRARTPEGISDVQAALAKAGYLQTAPTTRWDANAADAVRRFQSANGVEPSGVVNGATIVKLLPYLPMVSVPPAPPKLMYPALAYWLGNTPQGQTEIQEALSTAGFYNGPATGMYDEGTRAALKAFQTANDLQPNGVLDYATAEKLAPFLPKPKE